MNNIIISQTAVIHGRGRMPHKWVSGLTKEEKAAVKEGKTVLIRDHNKHVTCVDYKQVTYWKGKHGERYGHKNASPEIIKQVRECKSKSRWGGISGDRYGQVIN